MSLPSREHVIAYLSTNRFRYSSIWLLFVIIYTPYLLHGGFIIDDWGVIYAAKTAHGFWQTYTNWFPLFSNRPLSPLLLTIVSRTFGQWEPGYIFLNLTLWFAGLALTTRVFRTYISERFALFFLLFAGLPVIASTVIFSTIMQLTATASLLVWALSFYCITRFAYSQKKNLFLYLGSFLLILISLLTYEIIFPLLFLSLFFPALILKKRPPLLTYVLTYVLPVLVVVVIDLIFQKVIMPHYMVVYSRFNPNFNPIHVVGIGYYWAKALVVQSPIKLFQSFGKVGPATINPPNTLAAILMAIIAYVSLLSQRGDPVKQPKRLAALLFFTFLGCYLLYLGTSRIPSIGGYENRGLSSTWWVLAMLISLLIVSDKKNRIYTLSFPLFLAIVCGFLVVRDNYIQSYTMQRDIVSTCLSLTKDANVPSGATILGNVPHYLPTDYNYEEVFNNPWDFGEALFLASDGSIAGGNTFTPNKMSALTISDQKMQMDGWWDATYTNLWYFNYNPKGQSTLVRIDGPVALRALVNSLRS